LRRDYTIPEILDWLLGSGAAEVGALQVRSAGTNRIEIAAGVFVAMGSLFRLEAALQTTLADAPASGERNDDVYLDIWQLDDGMTCEPYVAVDAAPVRQDLHTYVRLAEIRRRAGSSTIAVDDIRDVRKQLLTESDLIAQLAAVTQTGAGLARLLGTVEQRTTALEAQLVAAQRQLQGQLDVLPPPGTVFAFAGQTAPEGYLSCDGRAVSRTEFARLFAVIGTTYGAGDGTTTFNLCDLRGRTVLGAGNGAGLSPRVVGQLLGAEMHTLTAAEMPRHNHGASLVEEGNHQHNASTNDAEGHVHRCKPGEHEHAGNTDHANASTYRVVHQAGSSSLENHVSGWAGGPFTDRAGNQGFPGRLHTHPFRATGGSHNHSMEVAGGHSHSVHIEAAGKHTHAVTVAHTGEAKPHSNLMPSIVMNYIIRT
jgi:microcystin-dependent protein